MPNKDKTIAAAQNRKGQAAWQEVQREKKRILATWAEQGNKFRVVRQADGGFRIGLEQTPVEGERVTRELAELCGMDPDDFVQVILGEVLTKEGRTWKPTKETERQELTRLRAETAELREKMKRAGF